MGLHFLSRSLQNLFAKTALQNSHFPIWNDFFCSGTEEFFLFSVSLAALQESLANSRSDFQPGQKGNHPSVKQQLAATHQGSSHFLSMKFTRIHITEMRGISWTRGVFRNSFLHGLCTSRTEGLSSNSDISCPVKKRKWDRGKFKQILCKRRSF